MSFRLTDLILNVAYGEGNRNGILTIVWCHSEKTAGPCMPPNCEERTCANISRAQVVGPAGAALSAEQIRELKQLLSEALEQLDDLR